VSLISYLFILVYFIFIFLVLEISVSLMVITGLEIAVARFQVVSMLTATGFTTKESELIASHPVRRRIAIFLILFGVFSLAVVIASISQILTKDFKMIHLVGITAFFAMVWLAFKNNALKDAWTQRFHKHLTKEYELHEMPIQEVLYINENDLFTAIRIDGDSQLIKQQIAAIFTLDEDVLLLLVIRGEEKIRQESQQLEVQEGDELIVYGAKKVIEQKFSSELARMKARDETRRE